MHAHAIYCEHAMMACCSQPQVPSKAAKIALGRAHVAGSFEVDVRSTIIFQAEFV